MVKFFFIFYIYRLNIIEGIYAKCKGYLYIFVIYNYLFKRDFFFKKELYKN